MARIQVLPFLLMAYPAGIGWVADLVPARTAAVSPYDDAKLAAVAATPQPSHHNIRSMPLRGRRAS